MRLGDFRDPIEVGEIDNFAFDFREDCGLATIVSSVWTCQLAPYQPPTVIDPAPQSHVISVQNPTLVEMRAIPDGTLQPRTGNFSVAMIGGFPASAADGTYILEATATLSDGRVLKLNATVQCKLPGA
jgi:hypothetical protein